MSGLRQLLIDFLPLISKWGEKNAIIAKAVELLRIIVQSDEAWNWFLTLFQRQEIPSFGALAESSFGLSPIADEINDQWENGTIPEPVMAYLNENDYSGDSEEVPKPLQATADVASYGLSIGTLLTALRIAKMLYDVWKSLQSSDGSGEASLD